jgi:hypothetical protein
MHLRLAALYSREDWWGAPHAKLHWVSAKKVGEARQELMRRRKPPTPCGLVAELSLGFWVSLLGTGNDYETRLWRPALRLAFPGYRGARKHLHWEFDHVRSFRNRIAHHEPIYRRHLAADHETILRLLGYISPKYATWVSRHDRVPEMLSNRGGVCGGALPARF